MRPYRRRELAATHQREIPLERRGIRERSNLIYHRAHPRRIVDRHDVVLTEDRLEVLPLRLQQQLNQLAQDLALAVIDRLALIDRHDVSRSHALHHRDLNLSLTRNHKIRGVPRQRIRTVALLRRLERSGTETADELTRHILQRSQRTAATIDHRNPFLGTLEPLERRVDLILRCVRQVPALRVIDNPGTACLLLNPPQLETMRVHRIFHIVHRIRDVIRQIHDLRLQRSRRILTTIANPAVHRLIVRIHAELAGRAALTRQRSLLPRPRIFDRRVQRRTRQIQTGRSAVSAERLRLEPRQQTQRLRIAFKAAALIGELIQNLLTVMSERRMPQVVRKARGIHDVGVATQRRAEFAAHLRDLERMRQPSAHKVVRKRRDHLSLSAQTAQSGGMQNAGAVTLKRRPVRLLRWFRNPALHVVGLIAGDGRQGFAGNADVIPRMLRTLLLLQALPLIQTLITHRKYPIPRGKSWPDARHSSSATPASFAADAGA